MTGSAVEALFILGAGGDGNDPLTEPVTLSLRTDEWTIPPGSSTRPVTAALCSRGASRRLRAARSLIGRPPERMARIRQLSPIGHRIE